MPGGTSTRRSSRSPRRGRPTWSGSTTRSSSNRTRTGPSTTPRTDPLPFSPETPKPSTDVNLADRDVRQRDLVPPEKLARCHAVVIGVGAVGRQVALQLAAAGVPALTLYDPDAVGVENLAVQGYWETDVGDPKVHAVANVCHQQFPRMELHAKQERFRKSAVRSWPADRDVAVFCCVDLISTRKLVWEGIRNVAGYFADGRMAAEVVRVLASDTPAA